MYDYYKMQNRYARLLSWDGLDPTGRGLLNAPAREGDRAWVTWMGGTGDKDKPAALPGACEDPR